VKQLTITHNAIIIISDEEIRVTLSHRDVAVSSIKYEYQVCRLTIDAKEHTINPPLDLRRQQNNNNSDLLL